MLDPVTIASIIFGGVTFIDHLLSFSPDGVPKSIIQAFIWIGHRIYTLIKKTKKPEEDPEDEHPLIDVKI